MANRSFSISPIIIILVVSLNLHAMQETMQMNIQGEPYIVSEAQKCHQLMPAKIFEGKLSVPVEIQREVSIDFFTDKIPEVTGDTENDCIMIIRDGKIVYTNSQNQPNPMSESLDEDNNKKNFQLDGTALFIGSGEMRGNQKKLLQLLKSGQTEETVLSKEKHLKYFFRFDKAIELVSTKENNPPFFAKNSIWKRSNMVRIALNHGKGKKENAVTFPWETNEIKQMNDYLNMDKSRQKKFIYNLSISEQKQFIKRLYLLNLTKLFNHDDFCNAVEFFVNGFNNEYSQKNIASFLQEEFLPKDIDDAVKQELLRTTPEFYSFFEVQKDKLIGERQLNENVVMKEYWDNLLSDSNSRGADDLNYTSERPGELIGRNVNETLRLNDHTSAIQYLDHTVKLMIWKKKDNDLKEKINILEKKSAAIKYEKTATRVFFEKNLLLSIFKVDNPLSLSLRNLFKIKENEIWVMDSRILKEFGPDLSFEKLNSEQLLLFISAKRGGRHPKKINNVVWESIDSELREKLYEQQQSTSSDVPS